MTSTRGFLGSLLRRPDELVLTVSRFGAWEVYAARVVDAENPASAWSGTREEIIEWAAADPNPPTVSFAVVEPNQPFVSLAETLAALFPLLADGMTILVGKILRNGAESEGAIENMIRVFALVRRHYHDLLVLAIATQEGPTIAIAAPPGWREHTGCPDLPAVVGRLMTQATDRFASKQEQVLRPLDPAHARNMLTAWAEAARSMRHLANELDDVHEPYARGVLDSLVRPAEIGACVPLLKAASAVTIPTAVRGLVSIDSDSDLLLLHPPDKSPPVHPTLRFTSIAVRGMKAFRRSRFTAAACVGHPESGAVVFRVLVKSRCAVRLSERTVTVGWGDYALLSVEFSSGTGKTVDLILSTAMHPDAESSHYAWARLVGPRICSIQRS